MKSVASAVAFCAAVLIVPVGDRASAQTACELAGGIVKSFDIIRKNCPDFEVTSAGMAARVGYQSVVDAGEGPACIERGAVSLSLWLLRKHSAAVLGIKSEAEAQRMTCSTRADFLNSVADGSSWVVER